MIRTTDYRTSGTCCKIIHLEIEGDSIKDVSFAGGCNGNLQGLCALVRGLKIKDVLSRLEGIRCGMKQTSCPDQLCHAIRSLEEPDGISDDR